MATHLSERATLRVLSTPRGGAPLHGQGVPIDALVYSAHDRDETSMANDVGSRARLMVATEGANGGAWWGDSSGRWEAAR